MLAAYRWATNFTPGSCSSFLRRSFSVMKNKVSSACCDVGSIGLSCNISPFGSGDVLSSLGLCRCGEAHVRSAFASVRRSRQGQNRRIHIVFRMYSEIRGVELGVKAHGTWRQTQLPERLKHHVSCAASQDADAEIQSVLHALETW